ncbi:MAG: hypothetical protein DM484_10820 [Candidatus Methylumidiphilus alinenensis]|uniref:Uncharacterized protein n=1 Tax=Candidatus Methylumidiphilus alinenensis TaxID=2202197 RepID=A0A2W4T4V1_9GAMM|nr:MAG: hypothetical protein DM484_10820 [Candidatus Methylumidiphilus alinenensis]
MNAKTQDSDIQAKSESWQHSTDRLEWIIVVQGALAESLSDLAGTICILADSAEEKSELMPGALKLCVRVLLDACEKSLKVEERLKGLLPPDAIAALKAQAEPG